MSQTSLTIKLVLLAVIALLVISSCGCLNSVQNAINPNTETTVKMGDTVKVGNLTISVSNFKRATPPSEGSVGSREPGFYTYHDYYTFDVHVANRGGTYVESMPQESVVMTDGSTEFATWAATISGVNALLAHGLAPGQYAKYTDSCDVAKGKTPDKVKVIYYESTEPLKIYTSFWKISGSVASAKAVAASATPTPTPLSFLSPSQLCSRCGSLGERVDSSKIIQVSSARLRAR